MGHCKILCSQRRSYTSYNLSWICILMLLSLLCNNRDLLNQFNCESMPSSSLRNTRRCLLRRSKEKHSKSKHAPHKLTNIWYCRWSLRDNGVILLPEDIHYKVVWHCHINLCDLLINQCDFLQQYQRKYWRIRYLERAYNIWRTHRFAYNNRFLVSL